MQTERESSVHCLSVANICFALYVLCIVLAVINSPASSYASSVGSEMNARLRHRPGCSINLSHSFSAAHSPEASKCLPLIAAAAASSPVTPVPSVRPLTSLERATQDCKGLHTAENVNVYAVIDELLSIGVRHGATLRLQADLFAGIQRLILPVLPSFSVAQRMAESNSHVSPQKFPVCRNECSVYQTNFGNLTLEEMNTIMCPVCKLMYIQTIHIKPKPEKVRENTRHIR